MCPFMASFNFAKGSWKLKTLVDIQSTLEMEKDNILPSNTETFTRISRIQSSSRSIRMVPMLLK